MNQEQEKTAEYWGAVKKYQKLLDHHKIWPDVQAKAWEAMLSLPPKQFIKEVTLYWEETFGTNEKNEKEEKINENKSLDPQTQLHQSHCEQWKPYRKNKKR